MKRIHLEQHGPPVRRPALPLYHKSEMQGNSECASSIFVPFVYLLLDFFQQERQQRRQSVQKIAFLGCGGGEPLLGKPG